MTTDSTLQTLTDTTHTAAAQIEGLAVAAAASAKVATRAAVAECEAINADPRLLATTVCDLAASRAATRTRSAHRKALVAFLAANGL